MKNFIRTLKKIYLYLFLFSTAVWLVEIFLPPKRFITAFGMISFALLGIFSRVLCFNLAKRHGMDIKGHNPSIGAWMDWIEFEKGNEEWATATMIFGVSCMITAILFGVLYCFVPRIE